jgi:hypothetical protein
LAQGPYPHDVGDAVAALSSQPALEEMPMAVKEKIGEIEEVVEEDEEMTMTTTMKR